MIWLRDNKIIVDQNGNIVDCINNCPFPTGCNNLIKSARYNITWQFSQNYYDYGRNWYDQEYQLIADPSSSKLTEVASWTATLLDYPISSFFDGWKCYDFTNVILTQRQQSENFGEHSKYFADGDAITPNQTFCHNTNKATLQIYCGISQGNMQPYLVSLPQLTGTYRSIEEWEEETSGTFNNFTPKLAYSNPILLPSASYPDVDTHTITSSEYQTVEKFIKKLAAILRANHKFLVVL